MKLEKYSIGIGDRFCHQGKAQLQAIIEAKENGIDIVPVWNKSYREHSIIGTKPSDTRKEADNAVNQKNWKGPYYVDADHINLSNLEEFIESSDFFTIDVADYIGKKAPLKYLNKFIEKNSDYIGSLKIPAIDGTFEIKKDDIRNIAEKFLFAILQAKDIYNCIKKEKENNDFIVEVSMDETDAPQTPLELFFILSAINMEEIPAQTVAPKFTGRFNKGVDYVGDISRFEKEFNDDLAVIDFAVKKFNLSENLKLSVHSGSDKFSIYKPINKAIKKFDAGLHLKTAGTTWLEELIGLAQTQGPALQIVKDIYSTALQRYNELCKPYQSVIDIETEKLPPAKEVQKWSGQKLAETLRHDSSNPDYNLHFRQLMHISYKIAAEMGKKFTNALLENEPAIAKNVTKNIYKRHILPIFGR